MRDPATTAGAARGANGRGPSCSPSWSWAASSSRLCPPRGSRPGRPSRRRRSPGPPRPPRRGEVLDQYCIGCHNERLLTGGLALDSVDATRPEADPELWERVIAKLRAGSMPPPRRPRPAVATYDVVAGRLEAALDRAWVADPDPGRGSAVHRLNRTEYTQRRSRPVCARHRRDLVAAGRRDRGRQLRQLRRRPYDLACASRSLPVGGPAGPHGWRSGCRRSAGVRGRSRFRCTWSRTAGRAKHCRSGHVVVSPFVSLPGRRRVSDQGASAPAVSGLHHGHGLASADRCASRRPAARAAHRRR